MVQYRPKSLHITASDISQGQNRRCVFKTVQYRLCICIFLRLTYQKDKTGVVYSKRWNIAFVFAYCCVWYLTRTKLVLCIQKGAISPKFLHIATSDMSQGQNWCCVFKKVQYRPMSLHIAASDIIITRADLMLCIPKSTISPMSLHIAPFDI